MLGVVARTVSVLRAEAPSLPPVAARLPRAGSGVEDSHLADHYRLEVTRDCGAS